MKADVPRKDGSELVQVYGLFNYSKWEVQSRMQPQSCEASDITAVGPLCLPYHCSHSVLAQLQLLMAAVSDPVVRSSLEH